MELSLRANEFSAALFSQSSYFSSGNASRPGTSILIITLRLYGALSSTPSLDFINTPAGFPFCTFSALASAHSSILPSDLLTGCPSRSLMYRISNLSV